MLEMMMLSEPALHHGTALVASQNHSALGFVFCSIFLDGIGCILLQENGREKVLYESPAKRRSAKARSNFCAAVELAPSQIAPEAI